MQELLEGETLRQRLLEGALPLRKAVDFGVQIARGLAAAHEKGIVHRDLKPDNVFVTKDGRVKILDFGLARQAASLAADDTKSPTVEKMTSPGLVFGTVGYMSPEQVRGRPADHRSDVFSFGSVLYEILSGRRAFAGESPVETMNAILKDDPPELAAPGGKVPLELDRIVRHCLEKVPEERFQSMRDIAFALEPAGSGSAPTAPVAVVEGIRRRPVRLARLAGGAVLILAVGLFLGRTFLKPRAPDPPSFRRLTFRRGTVSAARFAPDGQNFVFSAAWEGRPPELFVARAGSPDGRPLGLPPGNLASVSATGEMAFVLGKKPVLAVAPLGGGAPREVVEEMENWADWAPDGKSLAVIRELETGITLEYPVGKILHRTSKGFLSHARVSPKGDLVAFLEHPGGGPRGAVAVVDRDANVKRLTGEWSAVWGTAFSPAGDEIWFSARQENDVYAVWGVGVSTGRVRLILRAPADVVLDDVYRDGRVLLKRSTIAAETWGLLRGQAREENLSWLDRSELNDISADGASLLYSKIGEAGGAFYLRRPDAPLPVRLGEGAAQSLSPDGRWVLAVQGSPPEAVIVPTGAGETRKLPRHGIEIETIGRLFWTADGKGILFTGHGGEKPPHCYVQDLDGSAPRPISPEGSYCGPPSPDGKLVLAAAGRRLFSLDPAGGKEPKPVPGFSPGDDLEGVQLRGVQWSPDGRFVYVADYDRPPYRIYRVDLMSARREVWKTLLPPDPAGIDGITNVRMTPDGSAYAYSYDRALDVLYLVEGLR